MNANGEAQAEIRAMFPRLTGFKTVADVFVRPQVWQVFEPETLDTKMIMIEKIWNAPKNVINCVFAIKESRELQEVFLL